MASLLVRNAKKFELQRDSSQRDLKIRSNYRSFRVKRFQLWKGNFKRFVRKSHSDFKLVRFMEIRIRESSVGQYYNFHII